jgi:predicted RNase H-related nuclease YkuK (DUF458 family)
MDEENETDQGTTVECEENKNDENTDSVANLENSSDNDDDYKYDYKYDADDEDNNNDEDIVETCENNETINATDAEECYDDAEDNSEERENVEDDDDTDGMSDKLFSKVLSELITMKSRSETKKNQSKVIPCAKKFLSLSMSERSKTMTKNVRKNLLHICDFVHQGKFRIDISNDNLRFLRHLLDKRTPKEDVDVGLTEDLRTHAIIREVIDLVENNGYGTRKKPRTR